MQVINDEVIDVVVGISPRVETKIVGRVFDVSDVAAKLQRVLTASPGKHVEPLVLVLVWILWSFQERLRPKLETVRQENIWDPCTGRERSRICGCRFWLTGDWVGAELVFKVARPQITCFVNQRRRKRHPHIRERS